MNKVIIPASNFVVLQGTSNGKPYLFATLDKAKTSYTFNNAEFCAALIKNGAKLIKVKAKASNVKLA